MKGRKDHAGKMEHHKRARGGKIEGEPESGGHPIKAKEKRPERKRGGKVHGKHPGHRLDKRARGGRMTPSAPLSPAGNMSKQGYTSGEAPSKSRGEGKGAD